MLTDTYSASDQVSASMWEGTVLPDPLECNCDGKPHNTSAYRTQPILQSAFVFPAGCSTFFHTNFGSAFLSKSYEDAQSSCILSQMGLQSISPSRVDYDPTSLLSTQDGYRESRMMDGMNKSCLTVKLGKPSAATLETSFSAECHLLRLFDLAIDVNQRLCVRLTYSSLLSEHFLGYGQFGLYISLSTTADLTKLELVDISTKSDSQPTLEYVVYPAPDVSQIHGVGIYYKGLSPKEEVDLCYCHTLSIIPLQALDVAAESQYQIFNLELLDSTANGVRNQRLQWEWSGDPDQWPECLPWSKTTGPFSYFSVCQNGMHIGTSQSLAFPLRSEDFDRGTGESKFTIEAFCFAGVDLQERAIASLTTTLHSSNVFEDTEQY